MSLALPRLHCFRLLQYLEMQVPSEAVPREHLEKELLTSRRLLGLGMGYLEEQLQRPGLGDHPTPAFETPTNPANHVVM